MIGYLDRLNLRPNERRFVVVVFLVLFVVLNIFFVLPYRDAWGEANDRMSRAQNKLALYRAKEKQMQENKIKLKKFETENPVVPAEDQSLQFMRLLQSQAALAGVGIVSAPRSTTKTNNEFFLEQLQTVTIQSGEDQLVTFLFNLGSGDSLIRVRELSLRPDQPRMNLSGTITLVASYQRALPTKGGSSAAKSGAAPAARTEKPPDAPAAKAPAVPKPATGAPAVPKPGVPKASGTNAPASDSVWGKVKGWFGKSSSTSAPAVKPATPMPPAKSAPSTNKKP